MGIMRKILFTHPFMNDVTILDFSIIDVTVQLLNTLYSITCNIIRNL